MTIDGKDILSTYGCILQEGSYDSLLKYPRRKNIAYNDWAEADGIEPDLDVVEFEPRQVKLTFLQTARSFKEFRALYDRFISDLAFTGYREMHFTEGMIHKLRLNQNSAYSIPVPFNEGRNHTSFTLDFIEDDPSPGIATSPTGGITLYGDYAINGHDFAYFGIGSGEVYEEILKYPGVKSPFSDGKQVDLSTIQLAHKEVRLSLWMVASSPEEFLNNYRAFFYQLAGTGTQDLYIKALDGMVQVYYSDCTSFSVQKWNNREVGVRFSVTLIVPVVTWVDGGGNLLTRVLLDDNLGILTDEENRILEIA